MIKLIVILLLVVLVLLGTAFFAYIAGYAKGRDRAILDMGPAYREKQWRWAGWFFVVGGCVCLVFSLGFGLYTLRFIHEAQRASGEVTGMRETKDKDGQVSYSPTFQFKDASGAQHTVSSSFYQSPPAFHVGDKVSVLYRSDDPESAKIDSYGQVWGPATAMAALGLIFSITGLIMRRWPAIAARFKKLFQFREPPEVNHYA